MIGGGNLGSAIAIGLAQLRGVFLFILATNQLK